MASAQSFQSFTASVFPSQDKEVVLGKQPVMAEYGREVRASISQLPPEVSRELLADYREPSPQLVGQVENAILAREHSIEGIEQGANLDQQWLQGAAARRMDEVGLSADDEWNAPAP